MKSEIKATSHSVFLLVLVLFLASCDTQRVYEFWADIPTTGWDKDSIYTYQFNIADTLSEHNLLIGLRNQSDYAYQNLWLFVTSEAPAGQTVVDTVEITLASTAGEWFGNGGGSLYTTLNYFKPQVRFAQSGNYKISIQQGMRQNQLSGIRSVGLRVEKSK